VVFLKIAFVDDYVHMKTNSTEFIVELLKEKHEVKRFWRTGVIAFPEYNVIEINKWEPDQIMFFQRMPVYPKLKRFDCKNFVFIPMFDSRGFFAGKNLMQRLKRLVLRMNDYVTDVMFKPSFITFSQRDFIDFKKRGKTIKLKYFPEAKKQVQQKKPVLFFWERIDSLPFSKLMKMFDLRQFEKVYFMQRNDGGCECLHHSFYDLPKNVEVIDSWLPKERYNEIMGEANIAVAPRLCEGIGHGFLDYMSRGMCVFAYNDCTHNEYIVNGRTGFLFKDFKRIDLDKVNWKKMGKAARKSIFVGHKKWDKEKRLILNG